MLKLLTSRSRKLNLRENSSGSILMIAMWALSVLTIFAIAMGTGVNSKIAFVSRYNTRHSLSYIAESGVKKAIAVLAAKGADSEYDILAEMGGTSASIFGSGTVGKGKFHIGYDVFVKNNVKRYGVQDEEGKININEAGYDVIAALIVLAAGIDKKQADDLAAAIVDWRDTDDFPLINGVESSYYTSLNPPYACKNSPIQFFPEVMLIRGMTGDIYNRIQPYISLYGTGKININTAGEMVLRALGMSKSLIRKIMSFRTGIDRSIGTDDDNVFTHTSTIVEDLNAIIILGHVESAKLNNLVASGSLGVASTAFKIRSLGSIKNKKQVCEIICVYDRSKADSGEEAIKYWHQRYYVE
ncbi:MAG: general secretion pathway protein GspK [Candidatus Omnitrophica bacterium]|nr:general secretion pathway protein GspK [Candidatus Omnitrophota bacterium]